MGVEINQTEPFPIASGRPCLVPPANELKSVTSAQLIRSLHSEKLVGNLQIMAVSRQLVRDASWARMDHFAVRGFHGRELGAPMESLGPFRDVEVAVEPEQSPANGTVVPSGQH